MAAALGHSTTAAPFPGRKGTKPGLATARRFLANADRARAWLHRQATGNDLGPVVNIQDPATPSWKRLKTREQVSNLSVSPELRAYYAVLHDLRQSHPDCRLAFVTLNFSEKAARQLAARARKEGRTLATIYGKRVTRWLREAGIPAGYFAVIEDTGGEGRADRHSNPFSGLHVHALIAYHVDDEDSLKAVFRKDRNDTNNGMMWQQTYRKKWKGQGDFNDFTGLDEEGNRYRVALVNVGAADYMSKYLQRFSRHMAAGESRIYCPNDLRTAAKQRYERLRQRVINLDRHRQQLAGCTLHEVLSFVLNDRMLSWRDPEPVYDWEYEESA